ncbi:MAG TPA: 16S rRNA (cytosine(1402)-N(4))-methyltransferase RsmH [Polyangia bacterium]|nr:16S rRNA (cytosine(1402)-N(4))-methyltransferase RsmH [Polyangia bacterium]
MPPALPTPPNRDDVARHSRPPHLPVLLEEVVTWLAPKPGGRYCDGTLGLGGHARAVLEQSGPDGRLIGLDRDPHALAAAGEVLQPFGDRVTLVHARFSQAREVLERLGMIPVDGFLVDLGVSSPQLDRPERGFSFRNDGPLDMRMDPTTGESAADLLRRVDEVELAQIIRDYGEERHASRVARAIVEARRDGELDTTGKLAAIVARAVPGREPGKNPATRTFQALRIAVNEELAELEQFLSVAADCIRPGGRLCVIAFHSLEDRIAKRRLRALAGRDGGGPAQFRILTKHVVVAGREERARNPRARSAHLRAAERI